MPQRGWQSCFHQCRWLCQGLGEELCFVLLDVLVGDIRRVRDLLVAIVR